MAKSTNLKQARTLPRRNPARASAVLAQLLPEGVATAELRGGADPAGLLPAEQGYLKQVSPKRARDFACGRHCAHRALAAFGVQDYPLPARTNRCPPWPDHLTGSITHTDGFGAAAVARRSSFLSVGIDAEVIGCVEGDLWDEMFQPSEKRFLLTLPPDESARIATVLFSAREAFYKCQFPLTGQWLEFRDVTIDLAGWPLGAGSFCVRPAKRLAFFGQAPGAATGSFCLDQGLAITAMAVAAQ